MRALCVSNASSSISILFALRLRWMGSGFGALVGRRTERRVLVITNSLCEFFAGLLDLISKFLTSTFFKSFSNFPFLTLSDFAANNPQMTFELKSCKHVYIKNNPLIIFYYFLFTNMVLERLIKVFLTLLRIEETFSYPFFRQAHALVEEEYCLVRLMNFLVFPSAPHVFSEKHPQPSNMLFLKEKIIEIMIIVRILKSFI